ncbi:hypothetical protein EDC04DRAFT_2705938 [Pisolithus marmoratus]|nr:hypothetical protein EDC04DRAFT_2705938 [Pisolithus marmoratus]
MCFLPVRLETWNEKVEGEKKIQKVLMTGLGTGVGKISPAVCARQTVLVIKHFLYARSEEGQRTSPPLAFSPSAFASPASASVIAVASQEQISCFSCGSVTSQYEPKHIMRDKKITMATMH